MARSTTFPKDGGSVVTNMKSDSFDRRIGSIVFMTRGTTFPELCDSDVTTQRIICNARLVFSNKTQSQIKSGLADAPANPAQRDHRDATQTYDKSKSIMQ